MTSQGLICVQCVRSGFARKGDFKEHNKIHTGEKKFVCTECSKQFLRSGDLNKHKKYTVN